jgi:hypothetical protein
MIVIKGNLTIERDKLRTDSLLRQAQNRFSSETSSEELTTEIVAYANLNEYDITDATILVGDIIAEKLHGLVLVTGEVAQIEEGVV